MMVYAFITISFAVWLWRRTLLTGSDKHRMGLTGCEITRRLLDNHGLSHVSVEIRGAGTNELTKNLRLPRKVYEGNTLPALSQAIYEASAWIEPPAGFDEAIEKRLKPLFTFLLPLAWIGFAAAQVQPAWRGVYGFSCLVFTLVFITGVFHLPHQWERARKIYSILQASGCFELDERVKLKKRVRAIRIESLSWIISLPLQTLNRLKGEHGA